MRRYCQTRQLAVAAQQVVRGAIARKRTHVLLKERVQRLEAVIRLQAAVRMMIAKRMAMEKLLPEPAVSLKQIAVTAS